MIKVLHEGHWKGTFVVARTSAVVSDGKIAVKGPASLSVQSSRRTLQYWDPLPTDEP